ncbi:hypothetical protein PENCOP_c004G06250 [Penicillium coprophilum]|uniref:Uncharacterized protein n=1 Tax=Penicillium coprophilum TaxID=36646 RepID=A0A1V6UV31_9EURO|nr:hypothetical protein PENCOP_c004G06250 [Penicillium coprophilum]
MALLRMSLGVYLAEMMGVLSGHVFFFDGPAVESERHIHVLRDGIPRKGHVHRSGPCGDGIAHRPERSAEKASAPRNAQVEEHCEQTFPARQFLKECLPNDLFNYDRVSRDNLPLAFTSVPSYHPIRFPTSGRRYAESAAQPGQVLPWVPRAQLESSPN